MFVLLILCLFVGCLIVLPLIVLGILLRLLIGVALIPLRVAGFAIKFGLLLAVGIVGVVLTGALLLIPLLPVLALVFAIWLLFRLLRRQPATRLAVD